MTVAGEVVATIQEMADDADSVLTDVAEFFSVLPADLDLASAAYYLRKEFQRNDTGVDNRAEIYTYTDSSDYSGYDYDDEDDEDDWDEDEDEYDYYCCEDCG